MEELLKELLEEQKKTNELLQVIVSNKEQKTKNKRPTRIKTAKILL